MVDGIESKAAAKRSRVEGSSKDAAPTDRTNNSHAPKSVRQFKQATVGRRAIEKAPEEAKRVLSKLF